MQSLIWMLRGARKPFSQMASGRYWYSEAYIPLSIVRYALTVDTRGEVMKELATKECVPCEKGAPRLKGQELRKLQDQLGHGWRVVQEHHLEKEFTFKNFREALDFTNKVGE